MKKKMGVFIIMLLAGVILGITQPAILHSAQTGQGNPWDFLIDDGPYGGTKYSGPLSIYYEFVNNPNVNCGPYDPYGPAHLFITVRLSKGGLPQVFYVSSDPSTPICFSDLPQQGALLKDHLKFVFGESMKITSINNATYHIDINSAAFAADIHIAVK